ncbi:MAG: VOC family protein [Dehalococcoidia bacterium]
MTVDALQTVLLSCADLDASVEFYVTALALPLVQRDATMAILRAGLVQIVLDTDGNGSGSGATFVFKMSAAGNVHSRLRRFGIAVSETSSERTGRVFTVHDPDGRAVYLVERPI